MDSIEWNEIASNLIELKGKVMRLRWNANDIRVQAILTERWEIGTNSELVNTIGEITKESSIISFWRFQEPFVVWFRNNRYLFNVGNINSTRRLYSWFWSMGIIVISIASHAILFIFFFGHLWHVTRSHGNITISNCWSLYWPIYFIRDLHIIDVLVGSIAIGNGYAASYM